MSSKAITAASTHFLQFRLQYSSLALLYYDFALTFPKEIKYMWGERFRLSTALYICCRYALVANVLYLLAIADKLGSTCNLWYKIVGALSILGRAAVIVVFIMRTNAVYKSNKWILGYMSVVGLACVSLDITHVPGMRCVGSSSLPMSPEMLSILMVIFESSSAFLTTIRCVVAFRATGGLESRRHGLLFILFEQGIIYFWWTVFPKLLTKLIYKQHNLNFHHCGCDPQLCAYIDSRCACSNGTQRAPAGFFQRLPNAFTLPLSCILTARFILHLREYNAELVGGKEYHTSRLGCEWDGIPGPITLWSPFESRRHGRFRCGSYRHRASSYERRCLDGAERGRAGSH
ncbi:hypothetical protein MSAN_01232500 [Mycena sanguinolenta]|uniref:DUF6533 domain-containing protein n=1 Tax=Mycena sanguinolenta TaxID=230812 RepID=A0A8H6YHR3_9AGAR|nr:hypothetical protein MSAN_01232500 [Mycena sanguinolenta]